MLDGILDYLPSPEEKPVVEATDEAEKPVMIKPDPNGQLCALAFKVRLMSTPKFPRADLAELGGTEDQILVVSLSSLSTLSLFAFPVFVLHTDHFLIFVCRWSMTSEKE